MTQESGPKVIPILDARHARIPALLRDANQALADTRGRGLRDLRISVTDRCNFRCTYCMPKEVFDDNYPYLPHAEILTFEEIVRLARIFAGFGIEKIRLTGGEPLMRKGVEDLIAQLRAALPAIDITLTTNGSALKAKAKALKAAGLSRITVSLDSLDDATFRAMNDVDFPVAKVLEGIDAARDAGLGPVKINMVVKRGTNDQHIVDMARHFKGSGHILRFIEFMDVGSTNGWRMDDVIPSREVVRRIHEVFPCEPWNANYKGEVAKRWRYLDGSGEFGVISSVTEAFCSTCNRARLSTDGALYTCLFAQQGFDLKSLLRADVSDTSSQSPGNFGSTPQAAPEGSSDRLKRADDKIRDAIAAVWQHRSDRYSEIRTAETAKARKVEMSFIGG